MLEIKKISTSDRREYAFVEDLYLSSFPKEERRECSQQRAFTDTNPVFSNNIIVEQEAFIGFVGYWHFEQYIYIEHFATHPGLRGRGYGQQVLSLFKEQFPVPVVLEVEKPVNEISVRRIAFYKRQGFVLWEKDYLQPSYYKGGMPIPMYLMAYGALSAENDFETVRDTLYRNVYGVRHSI
ncbi:MAG: GNAT family N-acetyltransferase [Tannerella sp.]|jgi:ribosomal protein S18 acetylase RimI-like enzyme|nr:GNAT family N-acetyltransferase [Tannerella sp.]